jgi:serine/threonine protein phosphatase PrpC
MKIRSAACTSPGRIRKNNEDSWAIVQGEHLYVVADGMGGALGGEVASSLTVEALEEFFQSTDTSEVVTWPFMDLGLGDLHASRLLSAVALAHTRIRQVVRERPRLEGMGTTVVAAHVADGHLYLAHVGDSRCYRLRDGRLDRLTKDHTLANRVREDPKFESVSERDLSSISHILLRALGVRTFEAAEIELSVIDLAPGDLLLLCSDGVTDEVADEEIADVIAGHDEPEAAARALVRAANDHGGRDNSTALVIAVEALNQGDSPDDRCGRTTDTWPLRDPEESHAPAFI